MRKYALKLIRFWDSLVAPSLKIDDPVIKQKARLLSTFILSGALPFALLNWFGFHFLLTQLPAIIEAWVYIMIVVAYFLSRTQYYQTTVFSIFFTLVFLFFAVGVAAGPININVQLFILALSYLLAVPLLSRKKALVLVVILNTGFVALYMWLPNNYQPLEFLEVLIANLGLTLVLFVVMGYIQNLERIRSNRYQIAELHYKSVFDDSPIAMIEINASAVKSKLLQILNGNVYSTERFFKDQPKAFEDLRDQLFVVNMNPQANELYQVQFGKTPQSQIIFSIFDNLTHADVRFLLLELSAKRTAVLDKPVRPGCCEDTYVVLKASVAQGYENTWERVFFSAVDVTEVVNSKQAMQDSYDATLEGWVRALDMRDKETEGHAQRVTKLTVRFARIMGMNDTQIEHIRRGALLHDIGKLSVSDRILTKPDTLTEEERSVMEEHPRYSEELLMPIKYLRPAMDIPRYHHERWDGSGYPYGLKGEEIPLAARIFAIVDVWDALTSDRHYRHAWSYERAVQHLLSESGKHFDPKLLEIFIEFCL